MLVSLAGVLVASLAGSVHCAAMCGGFACFYAGSAGNSAVRAHVMYNIGRLISYTTLGIVAGAAGAAISDIGAMAGIARAAAIVSGVLMIAWGIRSILVQRGFQLSGGGAPEGVRKFFGQVLVRLQHKPPAVRAFAIGLLTTLLPCGWLYVFVVSAAGTGHLVYGMLVMIAFWAGTLPALVSVAAGARALLGPLSRRLPMASAAIVVLMGLLSLTGRLNNSMTHVQHETRSHISEAR